MILDKALNGLRDASLCWLELRSDTVESVGLWNDSLEPCVYGGAIHDENGVFLGHTLAILYVDDILLASSTEEAEDRVAKALNNVVPTKTTGLITPSDGGSLTFIGRVITQEKGGSEIFLGVEPQYINPTFEEYGVTKGSDFVPDIAGHLERTVSDSTHQKPLSDEAYSRFRRAGLPLPLRAFVSLVPCCLLPGLPYRLPVRYAAGMSHAQGTHWVPRRAYIRENKIY